MKTNVSPTVFNLTLGRQGSIIYLPLDFKCRALEYVQCGRDDWQYWITFMWTTPVHNKSSVVLLYVCICVCTCMLCMCTTCMYV